MIAFSELPDKDRANIIAKAVRNGARSLDDVLESFSIIQNEIDFLKQRQQLPKNLQEDTPLYNLRGALRAGLTPEYNSNDGQYHLGSRNPSTGEIFKSVAHPTYPAALLEDMRLGYYPNRQGTHTNTWLGQDWINTILNRYDTGGSKEERNAKKWINEGKHTRYLNYFINNGIDPYVALGIVGNIALESGFNPKATNGTHWGLVLNQKSIVNYIKKRYGDYSEKSQLKYLLDGLQGKLTDNQDLLNRFNRYLAGMKNIQDPMKAATLFEKYYEISGGQALAARKYYAQAFHDDVKPAILYLINSKKEENTNPIDFIELEENPEEELEYDNDEDYDFDLEDLYGEPDYQYQPESENYPQYYPEEIEPAESPEIAPIIDKKAFLMPQLFGQEYDDYEDYADMIDDTPQYSPQYAQLPLQVPFLLPEYEEPPIDLRIPLGEKLNFLARNNISANGGRLFETGSKLKLKGKPRTARTSQPMWATEGYVAQSDNTRVDNRNIQTTSTTPYSIANVTKRMDLSKAENAEFRPAITVIDTPERREAIAQTLKTEEDAEFSKNLDRAMNTLDGVMLLSTPLDLGPAALRWAGKGLTSLGRLAKPILNKATLAIKNYRYPLGIPQAVNNAVTRTVQDNGKIRLSLSSHTEAKPRLFVLDPAGDNKYYVHMRLWDNVKNKVPAANLTNEEKQLLFNALYNELPEGAEILLPKSGPGNYATRGTVAGLERLGKDSRFTQGTKGTLQYLDKDGKTVKTYEGTSYIKTPKITSENTASITPEQWTAAQDAAIARGDMAEALRLRDLHFLVKSNTSVLNGSGIPLRVYHGSPNTDITEFRHVPPKTGGRGTGTEGFYATQNREYANRYRAEHLMRPPNPNDGKIYDLYVNAKKVATFPDDFPGNTSVTFFHHMNAPERAFLEDRGYDGVKLGKFLNNNTGKRPEIAVFNPNQLKLADAITYDDFGIRIPLGKKDNFNIKDIRYALIPTLFGTGTATTLLEKEKAKQNLGL